MVLEPRLSAPERLSDPPFPVAKKRLVDDAVVPVRFVAKKLVEVELVVVLLSPVKFWKVDDAVARRLVVVRVPVRVRFPPVPIVKNEFVEDAVVEKKLVVVAEVPVALVKVKFWRVVDEVVRMFDAVRRPSSVTERIVDDALFTICLAVDVDVVPRPQSVPANQPVICTTSCCISATGAVSTA